MSPAQRTVRIRTSGSKAVASDCRRALPEENMQYRVTIEIDVECDTMREAAVEALEIERNLQ